LWHHVIDDGFGFRRNPVHNVIDAYGTRNVMDEKEQQCNAYDDEHDRHHSRNNRRKWRWQGVRCRECSHAIEECAEEDAQSPLGDAVARKADNDAWGKLH
jgi:hypothetical protein